MKNNGNDLTSFFVGQSWYTAAKAAEVDKTREKTRLLVVVAVVIYGLSRLVSLRQFYFYFGLFLLNRCDS